MPEQTIISHQILTGQIIQVLEESSKNIAKIRISPGFVDIPMNNIDEVYLGDEINIDCDILVHKITPKISLNEE